MTVIIECPYCQDELEIPEKILGKKVQCPICAETFTAHSGGNRLGGPRPYRAWRSRRYHLKPHRGSTILILGILSLFIAGPILGPIAWVMGNNDLAEMHAGIMDPEGESNTNTGRILGMIATILSIVALCFLGSIIVFLMSVAHQHVR
jgi:hypothetical protein